MTGASPAPDMHDRPSPRPHRPLLAAVVVVSALALAACGQGHRASASASARVGAHSAAGASAGDPEAQAQSSTPKRIVTGASLPSAGADVVYAAATTTELSPALRGIPERVYVPNSLANTVDVIDPTTFKVVDHFKVGKVPHHVAPSWDLTKLYVDNTYGDSLTVVDPRTGKPTGDIPVTDPYNLYFTPDGSKAIVVAERYKRLDFRDPHTWALLKSVSIPWAGADHLDFSADGRYLLVTTEFSGFVVKVDTVAMAVTGEVSVGGLPVDVKLSPDGTLFYVTNQDPAHSGVSVIDPVAMRELDFIPTAKGAHGLYISRDARSLYVSNRLAGSISVIDLATRKVTETWHTGGSPDMIQISPDGRQLWVSSRYDAGVLVVDTTTGALLARIKVGDGDHGIAYFPEPGRFSVGHNGVYR